MTARRGLLVEATALEPLPRSEQRGGQVGLLLRRREARRQRRLITALAVLAVKRRRERPEGSAALQPSIALCRAGTGASATAAELCSQATKSESSLAFQWDSLTDLEAKRLGSV